MVLSAVHIYQRDDVVNDVTPTILRWALARSVNSSVSNGLNVAELCEAARGGDWRFSSAIGTYSLLKSGFDVSQAFSH